MMNSRSIRKWVGIGFTFACSWAQAESVSVVVRFEYPPKLSQSISGFSRLRFGSADQDRLVRTLRESGSSVHVISEAPTKASLEASIAKLRASESDQLFVVVIGNAVPSRDRIDIACSDYSPSSNDGVISLETFIAAFDPLPCTSKTMIFDVFHQDVDWKRPEDNGLRDRLGEVVKRAAPAPSLHIFLGAAPGSVSYDDSRLYAGEGGSITINALLRSIQGGKTSPKEMFAEMLRQMQDWGEENRLPVRPQAFVRSTGASDPAIPGSLRPVERSLFFSADSVPSGAEFFSDGRAVSGQIALSEKPQRVLVRSKDSMADSFDVVLGFSNPSTPIRLSPNPTLDLVSTDKPIRELSIPAGVARQAAITRTGGLLAASTDSHLYAFGSQGTQSTSLFSLSDTASAAAYSAEGDLAAAAGIDGSVKIVEAATGAMKEAFSDPGNSIRTIAFAPNPRYLVVGGSDHLIKVYGLDEKRYVTEMPGPEREITSLQFSPDGSMLAAGTTSGSIFIWDTQLGRKIHELKFSNKSVMDIDFGPDGSVLAAANADGSVTFWHPGAGLLLKTLHTGAEKAMCVRFVSDLLPRAAVGCYGGMLQIWDWRSGKLLKILRGHKDTVSKLARSGNVLYSCGLDGKIFQWLITQE